MALLSAFSCAFVFFSFPPSGAPGGCIVLEGPGIQNNIDVIRQVDDQDQLTNRVQSHHSLAFSVCQPLGGWVPLADGAAVWCPGHLDL